MDKNDFKIMIIDDNKELSEMYKIKIEKEGYSIQIGNDGLDALAKIIDYKPDLILLDIMMPNMDGYETLKTIKELAPSIKESKILIFSNIDSNENIKKAIEYGADEYLVKVNNSPRDIINKINYYYQRKKNKTQD